MKTNQIMKRDFCNNQVSQRTKDGFFNATELLRAFNLTNSKEKSLFEFMSNKNTKEFIEALEKEINLNTGNCLYLKTVETTRGKYGSTWFHSYLFIKFSMWLSPEIEVQVIKWIYDNLIEFRNQAGDYYKDMCEVISKKYFEYYDKKADPLVYVNEAHFLNQLVFGNPQGEQRNFANSEQLKLMNKLQLANIEMLNNNIPKSKRHQELTVFAKFYNLDIKKLEGNNELY
jgi:hypothetical protein